MKPTERYVGSAEQEDKEFERLAKLMVAAQLKSKKATKSRFVRRALHPRSIAGIIGAKLIFEKDIPAGYTVGFVKPGAEYSTTVRLSNASPTGGSDEAKDLRGLAMRIEVSADEHHDLLGTNYPVSHARNAAQFVHFAHAMAGGALSRVGGVIGLIARFGPFEVIRMLRTVSLGRTNTESLAKETYWSRGAITWGDAAARYFFRPESYLPPVESFSGPVRLEQEFAARLAKRDVVFEMYIQPFVDEEQTPIEDTATPWRESLPIVVARLVIPKRDLSSPEAMRDRRLVDEMGFNPWNTTEQFRPLGHLNRARKSAYDASQAHRQLLQWPSERLPLRNLAIGGFAHVVLRTLNRVVAWHRLPLLFSLLNLNTLRVDLRRHNLLDTQPREVPPQARQTPLPIGQEQRSTRSYDGSYNDLAYPQMGMAGTTFGRNMPKVAQDVGDPNPVIVARNLLDRKSFIPATSLNLLAAAWIQFQVHDWVMHARNKPGMNDLRVPIPDGLPGWPNRPGGPLEREMRISGNVPFSASRGHELLFANQVSHWWDGSEVYGSDHARAQSLREGAKLRLDNGYLPTDLSGLEITGFNESWWMGLSLMHTLFAREHNLICDELQRTYSGWNDERVYQTARLIVSALIAKIHTVEWTPAILATEALEVGMKTNWNGPPADWMKRLGIWLTDAHALKGIPQTMPDHHTAPYSLTEEFTTVYRMHPLIPDDYTFYDFETGAERSRTSFNDIQGIKADDAFRKLGMRDALFSFGNAYPGAITLHNFPRALQRFERDGELVDLSVIDLVRTRHRGVPRYNQFRRNLRKAPIRRWEDMTDSAETNYLLKHIYGDIEKVDAVIGLLGEAPPAGFGFSDTAFRIFILMASRRIQSDRFLTVDFRPEVYSPLGMDWIAKNGMATLIARHCPELASVLPRGTTAFAPWRPKA